jgi:hypothetical protein
MKFLNAGVILTILLLIIVKCSNMAETAGGSTDTGNSRINASIYMPDGKAASGARVILRRSDYLSDCQSLSPIDLHSQKDAIVNSFGHFQIDSIDTGSYYIEVNDRISRACLLTCKVLPGYNDIELGSDTILPYAMVEGNAIIPPGFSGTVFVQIFGLERRVSLDMTGHFVISDLPAGYFNFRIAAKETSFTPILIDSVKVVSGSKVEIPYAGWKFQKRIWLNTTPGGADIAGTVSDFPVVVRLTKDKFDFSQAAKNGTDLRFTNSTGEPLQYEIEQWDSAGGTGIVWVKVDTVHGNSAEQYIQMYSGFPAAVNGSNSVGVFDTANGFQGVWHLSEAGNATAKDATVNGYDGAPYNMTPDTAPGAIGGAREFDGSSSYIVMTGTADSKLNTPQNGSYAISAWAYVDTFDTKWHVIAGKGHEQYYLKVKCFDGSALWEFDEYEDKTGWALTEVGNPPNSKSWVYLVGMRSGSLQKLYVNGVLALDTFAIQAGTLARNTGDDFSIGKYLRSVTKPSLEGYCPFDGKIDEVSVSNRTRSDDWIKLCYMNQRPDDRLVVFK